MLWLKFVWIMENKWPVAVLYEWLLKSFQTLTHFPKADQIIKYQIYAWGEGFYGGIKNVSAPPRSSEISNINIAKNSNFKNLLHRKIYFLDSSLWRTCSLKPNLPANGCYCCLSYLTAFTEAFVAVEDMWSFVILSLQAAPILYLFLARPPKIILIA